MTLSQIRSLQEKNLRLVFTSSITHEIRKFHVVVVQGHQSEVQKKKRTCKVIVVLLIQTYCFLTLQLSMPSPSLLFKLLIVGQVVMVQATKFSLSKTDLYGTLLFVSREQP